MGERDDDGQLGWLTLPRSRELQHVFDDGVEIRDGNDQSRRAIEASYMDANERAVEGKHRCTGIGRKQWQVVRECPQVGGASIAD